MITGLAPAIAEQTKTLIHTAVSRFVASPQFQDLWIQVNRVAHQGLVNLATGNTGGTLSIDESGTVTISTKEIIARVKTLLVEQGVDIATRIRKLTDKSPCCSRRNWPGPPRPSERWTGPPRYWPG